MKTRNQSHSKRKRLRAMLAKITGQAIKLKLGMEKKKAVEGMNKVTRDTIKCNPRKTKDENQTPASAGLP